MSDETPEINSAEAEAERILEEEFSKLDLDGEDCPMGDNCAIHHRVDESVIMDEHQYGRLITYVGDYVVVTSDNPELESPLTMFRILTGKIKAEDIPPQYETTILHVGPEGAMWELRNLDKDGKRNAIRFIQTHGDWENFTQAHETVVQSLKDGLIDVSHSALEDK